MYGFFIVECIIIFAGALYHRFPENSTIFGEEVRSQMSEVRGGIACGDDGFSVLIMKILIGRILFDKGGGISDNCRRHQERPATGNFQRLFLNHDVDTYERGWTMECSKYLAEISTYGNIILFFGVLGTWAIAVLAIWGDPIR